METTIRRVGLLSAALILLVTVPACSLWGESASDAVRRAVMAHEVDERGLQVDELIIRLSPGEHRADFGHGSRIVWLVSPPHQRAYREAEYFRVRAPERSYLFVQDIVYNDSQNEATVGLVIYVGSGKPVHKEVALHNTDGGWEVTAQSVVNE